MSDKVRLPRRHGGDFGLVRAPERDALSRHADRIVLVWDERQITRSRRNPASRPLPIVMRRRHRMDDKPRGAALRSSRLSMWRLDE